jgi:hypothetical protein
VSKETANGILRAGKGHWLQQRPDVVVAKGKGALETYWLQVRDDGSTARTARNSSDTTSTGNENGAGGDHIFQIASTSSTTRLVEWAVGLLANELRKVVAVRASVAQSYKPTLSKAATPVIEQKMLGLSDKDYTDTLIRIPEYRKPIKQVEQTDIDLGDSVSSQLRAFVAEVANHYNDNNPFHNMEVRETCFAVSQTLTVSAHSMPLTCPTAS